VIAFSCFTQINAKQALRVAKLAKEHGKRAMKIVAARNLVEWILEECLKTHVHQTSRDPEKLYSRILLKKITPKMNANAEQMLEVCKSAVADEPLMSEELDKAVQDRDAFVRAVALLKAPRVNASVLYCGKDLVDDEATPKPPSKKLRLEDKRMRQMAPAVARSVTNENAPIPDDIYWPYFRNAWLDLHGDHLEGWTERVAIKAMKRDWVGERAKAVKKFMTHFEF
jgi:hypothetical protein